MSILKCVEMSSPTLYSVVGHAGGLYISGVQNPYFEENVWDLNGWFPGIKGAERTIFSRNLYIQIDCGPATILRDIHTNSASEGLQFRTGGTMDNCLFALNTTGFDVGHQKSDPDGSIVVHTADVTNNVIMQSTDLVLGLTLAAVELSCGNAKAQARVFMSPITSLHIFFLALENMAEELNSTVIAQTALSKTTLFSIGKTVTHKQKTLELLTTGSGNTIAPNDVDLNASNNNPGGQPRTNHSPIQAGQWAATSTVSEVHLQQRLDFWLLPDCKVRIIGTRRCWLVPSTTTFARAFGDR